MRSSRFAVGAVVIALAGACTKEAGQEPQALPDKEAAFGSGNTKADCLGCSEADAKSALEQTGLASRFLRSADFWQVAYKFHHNRAQEMGPLDTLETGTSITGGDVYLFNYDVEKLERRVIGDYKRQVATLRIYQGTVANAFKGLVSENAVDEFDKEMQLELDDLLRAVGKTYFNEEYPNGRYVGIEPGDGVRPTSDAFPTAVPNIKKGDTATKKLPALPADLERLANKAAETGKLPQAWKTRDYRYFSFAGGEETYWAKGELWPFYVRSDAGEALLVDTTGVKE